MMKKLKKELLKYERWYQDYPSLIGDKTKKQIIKEYLKYRRKKT